jgi:hypothetical protein
VNITNVLHRSRTGVVATARTRRPTVPPPLPSTPPPVVYSLERGTVTGDGRRPRHGPLLVVAVAIAAVVAVALASGDDATERELRSEIAELTSERAGAVEALAVLEDEIARLRGQLAEAEGDTGELAGQVGSLRERIEVLSGERDAAGATVEELDAELQRSRNDLATARQRLTEVTADRDALARLFPLAWEPSVDAGDTVGVYSVGAERVYCSGLSNCGATPSVSDLTIAVTPEGHLRASIPGLVEGGLFRAGGALHLVADSTTAVPACAGATRTAGVTMTIYPGAIEVDRDGAGSVGALHAVITVDAPATATCPAVLAFTSAELTART